MSDHPSRALLERLVADDLPTLQRQATDDHIATCESCRNHVQRLEALMTERLAAVPPAAFLTRLKARQDELLPQGAVVEPGSPWLRRLGLGLAVVTATAVATVWVVKPSSEQGSTDRIQFKGARMVVHRKRAAKTTIIGSDDTVRDGDALRIVVHLAEPQRLSVWFVDTLGQVDAFFKASRPLQAGEHALPGSAVVNRPCRDSWVVLAKGAATELSQEALRRLASAKTRRQAARLAPPATEMLRLRCE